MPSVIFSGSKVKTLKDTLNLNGGSDIITSTTDPTTSAVSAEPGSLLLNKTTGFVYRKLDSGSSTNWTLVGSEAGGAKSYATGNNSTADSALGSGWTTADVTAYPPTTYSGGTVTATFARTTSSPLQGAGSMLFTPGGQYDSAVFTFPNGIDRADFARMHRIEFDYEIGTVASYTDGDVKLAVVCASDSGFTTDVQVIQPAGHSISKVSGQETHVATFQSHASNLYYKIFLVQTTASTGYTLKIDNFKVGPQSVAYGAPVQEKDYSSNFTPVGFGTVTNLKIMGNRIGNRLYLQGSFTAGTATAVTAELQLSGLTIDSGSLPTVSTQVVGDVERIGASVSDLVIFYDGSTTNRLYFNDNASSGGLLVGRNGTQVSNNNDTFSFNASIPILGWSSNVVVSDSADTRVVAAQAQSTGRNYSTGSDQVLLWSSKQIDTHSKFDVSTGLFTCPVPGIYEISASIDVMANNGGGQWSAGNVLQLKAYKNGSFYAYMDRYQQQTNAAANGYAANVSGTAKIQCNAGDTIGAYIFGNCTSPMLSNGGETITIKLLSGPAQIAASESVSAKIYLSGNHSVTGTLTDVAFNTKDWDSHGCFNLSTYTLTAPVAGIYSFQPTAEWSVGSTNASDMQFILTDSANNVLAELIRGPAATTSPPAPSSTTLRLLAGETVKVRVSQNSGGTNWTLSGGNNYRTSISINKVGNY